MNSRPVSGVVGLGTMGLGIAQTFAQAGLKVLATDKAETSRNQATKLLETSLLARVKAGKMAEQELDDIMSRLVIVDDMDAFANTDLIIEAIIETIEAKKSLFEALETIVSPHTILATNTSSLSVAAIAKGLRYGQRVIGLHFFNPAPVMKLVELVAWEQTNTTTIKMAGDWTRACGKTVIACKDRPGFIVNRCARPFYGEALALLEEGRSACDIDAAMLSAGYRIGPLSLIDLVGADINLAATQSLAKAMNNHPRYAVFDVLKDHVKKGHLGRKSGQGFLFPVQPQQPPDDSQMIIERIEATLVNEACYLLGEGGVSEDDIDTAMKLGLNFPRGPFEIARSVGFGYIKSVLDKCAATAKVKLSGRYDIAPALLSKI